MEAVPTTSNETPSKKGPPWKQIVKIALAFLITGAFVYWIIGHQIKNPRQIWEYIRAASLLPLLAILPVSFLSHLLRAWRWRRFIGRPVSLFYAFTSVMIGYAVNDVLPRIGEVARVVNMNRITRVPLANLLATLIAERILDVIALAVLIGLSLHIEGDRIGEEFPRLAKAGPLALVIAVFGLLSLFAVAYAANGLAALGGGIARRFHQGLGDRVEIIIHQAAEGLAFLKRPSQAIAVLIETTGIWLLYFVAFLLGLASFGLVKEIGYNGATVAFSMCTAGVLVPAVGAIGPYHEFGKEALTRFYHVDSDLAFACLTVTHAILFYVVGGLGGALAWGAQIWVRRKRRSGKPEGS